MLKCNEFKSYQHNMMKLQFKQISLIGCIENAGEVVGLPYIANIIKQSYPRVIDIFRMNRTELESFSKKEVDFTVLKDIISIASRLEIYMSDNIRRACSAAIQNCHQRMKNIEWIQDKVDHLNQEIDEDNLKLFQKLQSTEIS